MQTTPPDTIGAARWALVVAITTTATVGVLMVDSTPPAPRTDTASTAPMLQVAPGGTVELASLPVDHQDLYHAAADDPAAFESVTCYCGCEAFLGHRHLRDCFVRPDGTWERHATGCAICMAEARDAIAMRAEGLTPDEIARRIDTQYGAITAPAST